MVFETKCKSAWPSFVTKLIEVQNAELLQKVTNIMTKIEDEAFSIAMLLSQFAKLGKIKEIKKLLGKIFKNVDIEDRKLKKKKM